MLITSPGQNSSTFPESNQEVLTLVDGGEDGQVIPLAPLVLKARALDVVIAIDAVRNLLTRTFLHLTE
jgi:lysophospholipase